jgi:hypothetical protein
MWVAAEEKALPDHRRMEVRPTMLKRFDGKPVSGRRGAWLYFR